MIVMLMITAMRMILVNLDHVAAVISRLEWTRRSSTNYWKSFHCNLIHIPGLEFCSLLNDGLGG